MAARTRPTQRPATGQFGTLDTFLAVHQAIVHQEEVWGLVGGQPLPFYPHALGWRRGDPYVLGLVASADGGAWQWIRLADLEVPFTREGAGPGDAGDPRPPLDFLTHVFSEAA